MIKFIAFFAFVLGVFNAKAADYAISFYGKQVNLQAMSLYTPELSQKINKKEFANFEKKVLATEWVQLFEQLDMQSKLMKLDDYGAFNLYKKAVIKHADANLNTKKALVYMGMRLRGKEAIAVAKDNFFDIYIRMHQAVDFGYSITNNGVTYFSTSPDGIKPPKVEIMQDSAYKNIKKSAFAIDFKVIPDLGTKLMERKVDFAFGRKDYTSTISYNEYYVNYLDDLPSFILGVQLLENAVENYMFAQLDDSLALWTKHMDEMQKLNFLLHITQHAFAYKADREYRYTEKRNTVLQSVRDEYIDCEDKAVLFLFLAKRYCNKDGILLYNKEKQHVNCALKMNKNAVGHMFTYNGNKYMIAEPAFAGYVINETEWSQSDILNSRIIGK